MISSQEISVVVQGAILREGDMTKRCCESVRRFLPGAEIILSTWEGQNVDGISCDICIMNQDPGAVSLLFKNYGEIKKSNINRQIVSSYKGVEFASRKYVMKLRSDTVLLGSTIINIINEKFCESEQRIMCFEPINPIYINDGVYGVCDFWFFGLKDSMRKLWNIPLQIPHENDGEYDQSPEEYILGAYCKENNIAKINNRKEYISVLCNEFMIVQCNRSKIRNLKYPKHNSFIDVYIAHNKVSEVDWMHYVGQKKLSVYLLHYFSVVIGFVWAVFRKIKNVILRK